jgi:hypothetical protein
MKMAVLPPELASGFKTLQENSLMLKLPMRAQGTVSARQSAS